MKPITLVWLGWLAIVIGAVVCFCIGNTTAGKSLGGTAVTVLILLTLFGGLDD